MPPLTGDPGAEFRALHEGDIFIMPNAFDVGSAKLLEHLGFAAIATTSSGHAASLGRLDGTVTRDELLRHVEALAKAVSVPVSADAEHCFADTVAGVGETIRLLADAGAAGCSIEDFNPSTATTDPIAISAERVEAAVQAAGAHGVVVTARADGLLHGERDVDSILQRLEAFVAAGADCIYAPGLTDVRGIEEAATIGALNVLALPGVPPIDDLARLGVRRVSVGGALAGVAYEAFRSQAQHLLQSGHYSYLEKMLSPEVRDATFI